MKLLRIWKFQIDSIIIHADRFSCFDVVHTEDFLNFGDSFVCTKWPSLSWLSSNGASTHDKALHSVFGANIKRGQEPCMVGSCLSVQ